MNAILPYFLQFTKTNTFTAYLIVFLLALTLIKYLKLPVKAFGRKTLLFSVILMGLLLRILWISYSSHIPKTEWSRPFLEADRINMHAIEMTKGMWFLDPPGESSKGDRPPSGHRPIGYPLALGLVYKIFGVNTINAWVFQLLLYVCAVYLIFAIGKVAFSERIGLMAAFFFAIYPVSIYSIKVTYDEHLFLPLMYFGIYLLLRDVSGKRYRLAWLWYGLIFGYAAMTRTHAIFMFLVVGIAYLLKKQGWKKAVSMSLVTLLVMQAINLPWVIRNYKAWGVPVMYTSNANFIYAAVNSTATPEGEGRIPEKGDEGYNEELNTALNAKDYNPGLVHKLSDREMKKWIVSHPGKFLKLAIPRLLYFLGWDRSFGVWPFKNQFYTNAYDPARPFTGKIRDVLEEFAFAAYYILFYSFLAAALFIIVRRKKFTVSSRACMIILAATLFFYLMEHMVIYADRKYRYPLEPIMMLFACCLYDYLIHNFRWESIFKKNKKKAKAVRG